MKQVIAIFAGGGMGSICRYYLGNAIKNYLPVHFPVGTFIVNILACFIIGILIGYAEYRQLFSFELRLFLTVGFCGGFSTFSAFSLESLQMLQAGQYLTFLTYIFFSILCCIAATASGLAIAAGQSK